MNGILGLLITLVFGTIITFLFNLNLRKIERVSLGILLGFGLQTFIMFLFYLLDYRFTLINTLKEIGVMSAVFLVLVLSFKYSRSSLLDFIRIRNIILMLTKLINLFKKLPFLMKVVWLSIFGGAITSFIIGVFFPVYGWDSLVLYNFRAITFVSTGGMEDGISRGYFFGYPLMTSLAHTWMYFLNGNPHVFYWGIYVGFLGIVFYNLRGYLTQTTLAITLLILATLPSIYTGSYFDYTNFPYMVYLIGGIMYIARYFKEKNPNFLLIATILTGLSTWIRQTDPFWVINLLTILLLLCIETKKHIAKGLVLILVTLTLFFGIQQPWRLYETSFIGGGRNVSDQAGYAVKSLSVFSLERLIDVISTTVSGTFPTWQPYLLIAIVVGFFAKQYIKKSGVFIYFIVANVLLLFLGTYIFSYIWPENWKDIIESQQRLSSFIVPLLIVFISVVSDEYILIGGDALKNFFTSGYKKFLK